MHKSLLNHQFFTYDQILQAKFLIQHQFGFQLDLVNANNIQTMLICHNEKIYKCGFIYLFRKNNGNKESNLYSLITQLQSHNEFCVKENEKNILSSELSTPKIRSSSFSQYSGPQTKNSIYSPVSILGNFQIQKDDQQIKKLQDSGKKFMIYDDLKEQKTYTQYEFSILKKQLQFESKGLISKSTEFHQHEGYVTKVNFKCKFDLKCPFLVELKIKKIDNQKNKLYQLKKINVNHLQSCILDQEEIHFNITTRKIDKNMNLLIHIIQEELDAKPKTILQKFSISIGQKTQDFIYEGLTTKLKRRAIKKYFDNSVAKARNIAKQ